MIEGGSAYVWAAYAVALISLLGLAGTVTIRAAYWAREARKLGRQ
ncbi:MAG: heme exporter protein CcmD [Hyphomonadaceae bacterium]|nr:heme exporter protein CcmD [Hyphomonadaceae bacterium]